MPLSSERHSCAAFLDASHPQQIWLFISCRRQLKTLVAALGLALLERRFEGRLSYATERRDSQANHCIRMPDTDRVSELVREAERLKKEAQTIREKSAQLIARAEELTIQVVQHQKPQDDSK